MAFSSLNCLDGGSDEMDESHNCIFTKPCRTIDRVSKFATALAKNGCVYLLLCPSLHSILTSSIPVLFDPVIEVDLMDMSFGIANVSWSLCFVDSCMQLLH